MSAATRPVFIASDNVKFTRRAPAPPPPPPRPGQLRVMSQIKAPVDGGRWSCAAAASVGASLYLRPAT